jgi:hypothetical protein
MARSEVTFMRILPARFWASWKTPLQILFGLLVLGLAVPMLGQQDFLSKPPALWTEQDALKVLNDSPWAHSVTTSTQDEACGYRSPAIPGEFTEEQSESGELRYPTAASMQVKSDGAEYLIRWSSAKPVQAAVQRLIAAPDEKWPEYRNRYMRNDPSYGRTDLSEGCYNLNDMITISVILKKSGPGGTSFGDYAFGSRRTYPVKGLDPFICAGLRTANGVVYAHVVSDLGHLPGHPAITMSFPSLVEGKPLINKLDEKVEFRFVILQRVFETTFTINAKDLPDGSQTGLYFPTTFTDLNESSNSPVATNQ